MFTSRTLPRMILIVSLLMTFALLMGCASPTPAVAPTAVPAAPTIVPAIPPTTAPVAATTAPTAAPKAVQGGHISIAMWSSPDSFCPVNQNSSYGLFISGIIYETLLRYNEKLEFQPRLAEKWTISADKTVYTFNLNPKAKWHDGKPVTAEDIEYSIWIISHPKIASNRGNFISMIKGLDGTKRKEGVETVEGVKVVNPQTIQFTLKAAVDPVAFLENIGLNVFIMPKHLIKDIPADKFLTDAYWTKPVGAGPFQFVRYQTDQFVEMKRYDDFYLGRPNLDTLIVSIINPATMVAQMEKGELDMVAAGGIGDVPLNDWERVNALPNVKAYSYTADGYQYMIVRGDKGKPWGDKRARQALMYGINRQVMVDKLLKGQGMVANGPIIPVTPYYSKATEGKYPYDVAKAKALLKEANFDFNTPVNFIIPTGNAIRELHGEIIQQNLTDLGIKVNVSKMDFTSAMTKYRAGDYDLALVGWGGPLDPDVRSQFATGREYNFSGLSIPAMDAILEKGAITADTEERKKVYAEFQTMFLDELPIIPLYWQNRLAAVNKRVVGASHMAGTNNLLRNVWEWSVTDGK